MTSYHELQPQKSVHSSVQGRRHRESEKRSRGDGVLKSE